MSEKKETKESIKSSERRESESSEEGSASFEHAPNMPSSESSTNQSSNQSEEPPVAGGSAVTGTDRLEITASSLDSASPSRLSFKKKVSNFLKSLSPKKNADAHQSPQKSSLSVASRVDGLVTGVVNLFRKSNENTALVDTDYECTPPPVKPPKEFYCKIDTFVDREGKPKTSGNLTDSTSLGTSSEVTSPSEDATSGKSPEECSPTEESLLIKPEEPLSEEKSPKKDLPKNK